MPGFPLTGRAPEDRVQSDEDEFMNVRERLSENPMMYSIAHRTGHRAMMRRFSFGEYLGVEDDGVVIGVIMYGSRDLGVGRHHPSRARTDICTQGLYKKTSTPASG